MGDGDIVDEEPVAVIGVRPADGRRFAVPIEILRKHTLVVAGSGAGKTVLVRRIVEQCALRGVSAIVLDPNGDLGRLGDAWPEPPADWSDEDRDDADQYLAQTEVLVWTPGRTKGRPLVFDPLPDFRPVLDDRDEFERMLQTSVASLIPRAKVSGRSQRAAWQEAVLSSALEHHVRNGGRNLEGLIQLMRELPPDITTIAAGPKLAADMADTLTAAMRTDRLFGGDGDALDPGMLLEPSPGKRARISVISFIGLPTPEHRQGFVNQLQMELFSWIKKNPAGDRPLGGLLVMDEAQLFAPSRESTPSLRSTLDLVTQARKYGLGLVFATQAPKNLHNNITGNTATQFFGRLTAPVHIDAAEQVARARGGQLGKIAQLEPGVFFGATEGRSFERVKVPYCLSYHPSGPLTEEETITKAAAVSLRPGVAGRVSPSL
jgi:hypothetical protein